MYYCYRHIRLDKNEPFYIGVGETKKGNTFRQIYERALTLKRNKFWRNIAKKCKYEVEIIFESEFRKVIFEKEREFIKLHGRRDLGLGPLVNHTDGGDGISNISEVTRARMRKAKENYIPWNKGLTKETDERVRNNALQTSISCKGRTFSKETLEKFSKARKGKKLKPHSIETKKKIGLSNSKKVVIEGIIYNSGAAAANALGISTPLLHWRIKAKTFPNYIMAD